ncbi:MAG: TIGR02452 family protein [Bacteroidales bacterium]|jgi:uncharacterized protein (TIGR02452 family)|nr:TIGR02452 family protein [Bacteroidales bacterium]
MTREQRIQNAEQTLRIIEKGDYPAGGRTIDISNIIRQSVNDSELFSPETLEEYRSKSFDKKFRTTIEVRNQTSMEAASDCVKTTGRTGCLNFASAKNPGGGFLGGALAQEECLASASSLYPALIKFQKEMYEYNKSRRTYLYSDYMIYSPDVCFFKNDDGELLENPYQIDIITSPAVNVGAMYQNNTSELPLVEKTMMKRTDKLLSLFANKGVETLILGAWGCGVFRNEPQKVAGYFAHYLEKGGKYDGIFGKIVFAVFDRSKNQENINAFKEVFRN